MAMPMEQSRTRFSHAQITKIHKVLVDGNSTGLTAKKILEMSRLELTIVDSLLNRFFERKWIFQKNMKYRLTDAGNRAIKKMLDQKEGIFDLPILDS